MLSKRTIDGWIHEFKRNKHVAHHHYIKAKEARYANMPEGVSPAVQQALAKRGIAKLYEHQRLSYDAVQRGENIVTITPTASGKTLCYNLSVIQAIVNEPTTRALYLFPTKALANDQRQELNEWIDEMGVAIRCFTYDGDTAPTIRSKVRDEGQIVITNPDMLHSAILPHHPKWITLFENVKYVVIDELHTYRGVFGSHVANVIRRLKRIAAYYGQTLQFICTSATIANPQQLAERLIGEPVTVIDENGAPSGDKHFFVYNPPVVNEALHVRRSATTETVYLAKQLLEQRIQTIVFARSRVRMEVILTKLQSMLTSRSYERAIRGYRGGYLPLERREIERGLRDGSIQGVVSTNALELGVDIGQLQACVINGYPGTIASTWQQAGRAGRRSQTAVVIFVASSAPIDQYIAAHPEHLFHSSPEQALIEPDHLLILVDHLKCAAFELPFQADETFGGVELVDLLDYLVEQNVLHRQDDKWHWMADGFPAHNISLRSCAQENVVIIDQSVAAKPTILGEMDTFNALTQLHEQAIYLHAGETYQVEQLDWDNRKAFVRQVDVEYFTDANLAVQLKVLDEDIREEREEVTMGN